MQIVPCVTHMVSYIQLHLYEVKCRVAYTSSLPDDTVPRLVHQLCLDRQTQPLILCDVSAESLSCSACRLPPASHVQRQRQPPEVIQIMDSCSRLCALCGYLAGSGYDTLLAGLVSHNCSMFSLCVPESQLHGFAKIGFLFFCVLPSTVDMQGLCHPAKQIPFCLLH